METTQRLVRTWMASGRDVEVDETVSGMPPAYSFVIRLLRLLFG